MGCFSCRLLSIKPPLCGRHNLEWALLDSSRSLCETRSFTSWRACAKLRIAWQFHLTSLLIHSVILVSVFQIVVNFTFESSALFTYILNVLANPALLSILGARLLFNMKEAATKGLNEGTSCGSKSTISDIEFGVPPEAATSQSHAESMEAGIAEIEEICWSGVSV